MSYVFSLDILTDFNNHIFIYVELILYKNIKIIKMLIMIMVIY